MVVHGEEKIRLNRRLDRLAANRGKSARAAAARLANKARQKSLNGASFEEQLVAVANLAAGLAYHGLERRASGDGIEVIDHDFYFQLLEDLARDELGILMKAH